MPKALELQLPEATEQVRLFHVSVPQPAIDDLRARLRASRFPNQQSVKDWSQGVPLAHAKSLIEYWESGYDWRRFETELNSFPNFRTWIDGLGIHFIHGRSPHPDALPILLTHGWPGSIAEFIKIIRPLWSFMNDSHDEFRFLCTTVKHSFYFDANLLSLTGCDLVMEAQ